MSKSYVICAKELDLTVRRAVAAARRDGAEICGLLANRAGQIFLQSLRNKSKKAGAFSFYAAEVRGSVASARRQGNSIVGTFHSHPSGIARPGASDIEGALDDSLMLVIDCVEQHARLWRVIEGKALPLLLRRTEQRLQATAPGAGPHRRRGA